MNIEQAKDRARWLADTYHHPYAVLRDDCKRQWIITPLTPDAATDPALVYSTEDDQHDRGG